MPEPADTEIGLLRERVGRWEAAVPAESLRQHGETGEAEPHLPWEARVHPEAGLARSFTRLFRSESRRRKASSPDVLKRKGMVIVAGWCFGGPFLR